ncbi:hypothetical protein J25TS5_41360 [Paenibacillus faecis]|nr:hypothetical protein J25TS5_41360 [Paenibacillus faecis]
MEGRICGGGKWGGHPHREERTCGGRMRRDIGGSKVAEQCEGTMRGEQGSGVMEGTMRGSKVADQCEGAMGRHIAAEECCVLAGGGELTEIIAAIS